ncbi:MAG: Type 1 glutamine amidotransferase-like domain-containing protein [Actinomycetes bacterium]
MHGLLALVGSGEYLPVMQPFETEWLLKGEARGKKRKYVQLATAAGKESTARHEFWKNLGAEQAARMGVEHVFLPVFTREDALSHKYDEQIDGAALIYLSGGDPGYLVSTLETSPVWNAIYENWKEGSSLAGCSAGAMAMHGLGVLPLMKILPHYDRYFRFVPDKAAKLVGRTPDGGRLIGIDEKTALVSEDLENWVVQGEAKVHLLDGPALSFTYEQSS